MPDESLAIVPRTAAVRATPPTTSTEPWPGTGRASIKQVAADIAHDPSICARTDLPARAYLFISYISDRVASLIS
jgi:hypothetical protein